MNLTPLKEKMFSLLLVSHACYCMCCDILVTVSTPGASISEVTNPKEELRMQIAKPDTSLISALNKIELGEWERSGSAEILVRKERGQFNRAIFLLFLF